MCVGKSNISEHFRLRNGLVEEGHFPRVRLVIAQLKPERQAAVRPRIRPELNGCPELGNAQ